MLVTLTNAYSLQCRYLNSQVHNPHEAHLSDRTLEKAFFTQPSVI